MGKSIYLINPKAAYPSYYNAEVFEASGLTPAVTVADLAVTTVAAMAPPDFEVEICEANIFPINYDHPADYIGITGKNTQFKYMREIATEFRKRGKTVIIGGPFASLDPDAVRPFCDILVQGEMEDIAEGFFNDLRNDTWKDFYLGTQPDLRKSPLPRWDLYPNDSARIGAVQTSRGCPFECEFCDVIQYLGRKQRHKDPAQVIAELDVLYDLGYRAVFLSDDNLTVYRRRAKELLTALKEWNLSRTEGHMTFITQVSVDTALDEEILRLCAEAGVSNIFVGIETPNEESLRETKKRQNLDHAGGGGTLMEKINKFTEYGILMMGGMIVGFDHDDKTIFDLQFRFAMQTPIPIFTLVALVAPAATPLYDRMKESGRLIKWDESGESMGTPWRTNIQPVLMSQDELLAGIKWLANNLYTPANFAQRIINFIDLHGKALDYIPYKDARQSQAMKRQAVMDSVRLVRQFAGLGPEEHKAWQRIVTALGKKPYLSVLVMGAIANYMQIRYMYDQGHLWDEQLVDTKPDLDAIIPTLISAAEIPVQFPS